MRHQQYENLIERVRQIDPTAADYLAVEAPKLTNFVESPKLEGSFNWSYTPQGWAFWNNIEAKLEGK